MAKLDELLQRKREKEAEIKEAKRQARRLGYKVTSIRKGISGGQDLANASIHRLQEELREINRDIDRERGERPR